jgi:hypothetical protein
MAENEDNVPGAGRPGRPGPDPAAPHVGMNAVPLKWGKALYYAGRKDDAKKQNVIARGIDLSASDKAALGRWIRHG